MTERMAYVALVRECRCLVAACVDEPSHQKDTAKFVAEQVRDGFMVERVGVEEARAMPGWKWPCEHMEARTAEEARLKAEADAPQKEQLFA